MLHSFLGSYLDLRFLSGAFFSSTRCHSFLVQNPSTGKSQAQKAVFFLLQRAGIPATYTVKMTDAALLGTILLDKKILQKDSRDIEKAVIRKYGELYHKKWIGWDEGDTLLRNSPYSENTTDILQMAMDEPGYVSKQLSLGSIEYYSNTTISACSYPTTTFSKTAFEKGFLQRSYISFKRFSDEEKAKIEDDIAELLFKNNFKRNDAEADLMKYVKDCQYYYANNKLWEVSKDNKIFVKFDKEEYNKFYTEKLKPYYEEKILDQYSDRKQDTLESFWGRKLFHICKFATHHAYFEKNEVVKFNDLCYALDRFDEHINSVKVFLSGFRPEHNKYPEERMSIITDIILNNGGTISRADLLENIRKMKEQKRTDLSKRGTYNLIEEMIKNKKIKKTEKARSMGGNEIEFSIY